VKDRLHRTGLFAALLAGRGHRVTWWTSAFDHFRKRSVGRSGEELLSPGLTAVLLDGGGYRRNLSLARMRDHRRIAQAFREAATHLPLPDIVVAALPSLELPLEAVRYGRTHGVPVVLDMRDMWPDIFVEALPRPLRALGRLAAAPLFRQGRKACSGATAITGITEAFVDWGLARGGRVRSALDRSFPMGYISSPPPPDRLREAEAFWDSRGLPSCQEGLVASFVGTIGFQFDFSSILGASRLLAQRGVQFRLILCGAGDRHAEVAAQAKGIPNVYMAGWVDAAQIHVLLRRSGLGLDPLPDRFDFLATVNNKAIEYLSAGLPVISCPERGILYELLRDEGCGLSYPHGDSEALAQILERLFRKPGELEHLAANAMRVYQERFVAETVYTQMAEYLEEVVSAHTAQESRAGE
jgi:glycosyltransferase involved in cell wall biosynthesis